MKAKTLICFFCLTAAFLISFHGNAWADNDSDYDVAPSLIELPDAVKNSSTYNPDKKSVSKKKLFPSAKAPEAPYSLKKQKKTKISGGGGFPWGNYEKNKQSSSADKKTNVSKNSKKTETVKEPVKDSASEKDKKKNEEPKKAPASSKSGSLNNTSRSSNYGSRKANANSGSVSIGAVKTFSVQAKNRTYKVSVRTTGMEDEFLVPVDDQGIKEASAAFGASTFKWSDKDKSFNIAKDGNSLSLKEGELDLPENLGGRHLDIGIRQVDGKYYFPLSVLEDVLKVRITVQNSKSRAWIDPLVSSVKLNGSGRNLSLDIKSTAPVNIKTFRLNQPNRYVIDVEGGVLDAASLHIDHPEMGDIRLGQFSLGPAVARIVIPTTLNIKVTPPGRLSGQSFSFGLELPKNNTASYAQEKLLNYGVSGSTDGKSASLSLTFSGPIQYEWRRLTEGGDRFILDLKRVVFPENKYSRTIDGDFVKSVRISQYASSPIPVSRIVLDLKGAVSVRIGPGPGSNCLNIDISNQVIDSSVTAMSGEGSIYGVTDLGGSGRVICIDPGHGGSDSGCLNSSTGLMEKDVTLDICLKMAYILRQRGWKVILTRESDRDVTWAGSSNTEELDARAQIGNRNNADVFVSVHCNAAANISAVGTSTHVYSRTDRTLAECIHPYLVKATRRHDRGIQQDRFYVLLHTNMPSVLIETAFLTNPEGAKILGDDASRTRIAEGISDGVCEYAEKYLK